MSSTKNPPSGGSDSKELEDELKEELKRLVYIVAQSPQNSKYKHDARIIAQGNRAIY